MADTLARWNKLSLDEAAEELLSCCASKTWARAVAARRPIHDESELLEACDCACAALSESDWMEAFSGHPRIGETRNAAATSARSAAWSADEQRRAQADGDDVQNAIRAGNREYEKRFRRIFIICAAGKSGGEILQNLNQRLRNDERTELRLSAEEQRKITQLRLRKWLAL